VTPTPSLIVIALLLSPAAGAQHDHSQHAPPESAAASSSHVAPDPPSHPMEPMTGEQMVQLMEMNDAARFGAVSIDRLEWRERTDEVGWEATAWYGGDHNKLVLKTEGEYSDDNDRVRNEALWDHVVARWWSLQSGVRYDSGSGPSRTWAALGMQGLAPYWFDVDATFYVGDAGRTALRAEARYDLRLTQRLILQPQLELNLYGKNDPQRQLGSGLSDLRAGLRLRYEVRREFAPYIGVHFNALFGETADLAQAAGNHDTETQFVAGIRFWF